MRHVRRNQPTLRAAAAVAVVSLSGVAQARQVAWNGVVRSVRGGSGVGGPETTASAVAGAAEEAPAAEEADPALVDAKRIYERGLASFETADYAGAIDAWTDAYTQIPNTRAYLRIRLLILYNLATAHEKAYEIDQDVRHLRKAKVLFVNFLKSIPMLFDLDDPKDRARSEKERTKVEARLSEIERALSRAEAEARRGVEGGRRSRTDLPKSPRPLFVSGGVALGVGLAGLGLMTGGLVVGAKANDIGGLDPMDVEARRRQFDRGRTGNVLAVVGGVVGGAGTVVGAALLGVGGARRRAASGAAAVRVGPLWTRRGAGLRVRVRF